MRSNARIILLTSVALVILANPAKLEAQRSIDKLQAETSTETIPSTVQFMKQIWELKTPIQKKLLKSRLINTALAFRHSDKYAAEGEDEAYSRDKMLTGSEFWTMSKKVWIDTRDSHYRRAKLELTIIVQVVPNAEMLAWMKARDEYVGYSQNDTEDQHLSLDVTGVVESFEWTQTPSYITDEGRHMADPMTCELALILNPFSTQKITYGTTSGSVAAQTQLLQIKTREWVQFYMGKRKKPEPIAMY